MGDIIHWNSRGLNVSNISRKTEILLQYLEKPSQTLAFNVVESRLKNYNDIPLEVRGMTHLYHILFNPSVEEDPASGTFLLVNKTEDVLENHIIIPGRLMFCKTRNLATQKETFFISTYLKSKWTVNEFKKCFSEMDSIITSVGLDNVVIMGDFNYVTSKIDRNKGEMSHKEVEISNAWLEMERKWESTDSFRVTNPRRKLYSYSTPNQKVRSRIDRIYIHSSWSSKVKSTVFCETAVSDHKLIILKILNVIEKGPGNWILNNSFLKHGDYKKGIKEIISSVQRYTHIDKREAWDELKEDVRNFSRSYAREYNRKLNYESLHLRRDIEQLESLPQYMLTDERCELLKMLKMREADLKLHKIKGTLLRAKIPHLDDEEPTISYVARLEKLSGVSNEIYCLKNENGVLEEGTDNVMKIAFDFYKDLYNNEPEDYAKQNIILDKLDKSLPEEDNVNLEALLSEKELHKALLDLRNNKSPGPDGLTKEFYVEFWTDLKYLYMDMVKDVKSKKELCSTQKRGLIRILYKKGDRTDIKNYRPISLLNVDVKIITRALSQRLASVLPNLIHPSQTGIPGRHIFNNVHTVQDLIDCINDSKLKAALIFLDQEKAFDRMSHKFIFKTLRKFGFKDNFIGWIETLYSDISSNVMVNGFETFSFQIKRGVRQGCPLSPLLYVLMAEALGNSIRKNDKIAGFTFRGNEHKTNQYADDMHVCVTTMESFDELFKELDNFEKATNARLNKSKTEAIWVGSWKGRTDKPYNLKWKNEPVKFLGIYVGNQTSLKEIHDIRLLNFNEVLDKIQKKATAWKHWNLSIKGRVKVINTFLFSRLWYRTECVDLSNPQIKQLNDISHDFIWNGRSNGQVSMVALKDAYDNGGMQLVDISTKIKVQRLRRLVRLMNLPKDNIERYLSDNLVCPNDSMISGLDVLFHNYNTNLIKNIFYKNAIKIWKDAKVIFEPASIQHVKHLSIFENVLVKDNEGNFFKKPIASTLRKFPNYPIKICHLPCTLRWGDGFGQNIKCRIRTYNRSCHQLNFSGKGSNEFFVKIQDKKINVEGSSREIYLAVLNLKYEKHWELKWNAILGIERDSWDSIWRTIFQKNLPYQIQSTIWKLVHLNFFSDYLNYKYFGHLDNDITPICKLCGNAQLNRYHHIIECGTIFSALHNFTPLLQSLVNIDLTEEEMAFGLTDEYQNFDKKCELRNYVTFSIRHISFINRAINYGSPENAVSSIVNLSKSMMIKDLKSKWFYSKSKNEKDKFISFFLQDNIIGRIIDDDIHFNF